MKSGLMLSLLLMMCGAAMSQKYAEGRYYTHDGQRVDGLIDHVYGARMSAKPDNHIFYKENAEAKRKKLTTTDIRSFVVKGDSFIIVKNFTINGFAHYEEDFVKVIRTGKVNLYEHFSTTPNGQYGSSTTTNYLVEKDGVLMRMRSKDFNDNVITLFGDNTELTEKIRNKTYRYRDLEKIVEEYNAHALSKS